MATEKAVIEPADTQATHWTIESVYSAEVAIPIGDEAVDIAVDAEVPRNAAKERLPRRGNRYWPTLVNVGVHPRESFLKGWDFTMHAETARELGLALIAAANASDAIDTPDTDTCGHWAPCDCCKDKAAK